MFSKQGSKEGGNCKEVRRENVSWELKRMLLLPFIIRIKVGVWTEICSGADSRLYEPVEIGRFSAMLTCEEKKEKKKED